MLEHLAKIAAMDPAAASRAHRLMGVSYLGGRLTILPMYFPRGMSVIRFRCSLRAGLEVAILASMATYEYRVTEAADGTFPVELWSSRGDRSQLIYKTRGFQTRELAEAWIVPVEDRSGDPPSPRSRVIYLKPRSSTFNP